MKFKTIAVAGILAVSTATCVPTINAQPMYQTTDNPSRHGRTARYPETDNAFSSNPVVNGLGFYILPPILTVFHLLGMDSQVCPLRHFMANFFPGGSDWDLCE